MSPDTGSPLTNHKTLFCALTSPQQPEFSTHIGLFCLNQWLLEIRAFRAGAFHSISMGKIIKKKTRGGYFSCLEEESAARWGFASCHTTSGLSFPVAQQHPGHPKKGTAERQEPRTRFGALCWRKGEVNTEKRQRFLPTAGNGTNLWIKRRVAGVNLFALCTRTLRPTFEEKKKHRERATFSQKERDRSHSLQTTQAPFAVTHGGLSPCSF